MCFGVCLFRIKAMIARPPIVCFDFGALTMLDRIQTIPFKIIPKASQTPQYRGTLIQDV